MAKERYLDVSGITLADTQILVVLSDHWSEEDKSTFARGLKTQYPEWQGFLLCLGTDEDLSAIPEAAAIDIWSELSHVAVARGWKIKELANDAETDNGQADSGPETEDAVERTSDSDGDSAPAP